MCVEFFLYSAYLNIIKSVICKCLKTKLSHRSLALSPRVDRHIV